MNQYDRTMAYHSPSSTDSATSDYGDNSHMDESEDAVNGGSVIQKEDVNFHTEEAVTTLHCHLCTFDTNDSEAYEKHVNNAHTNLLSNTECQQ